MKKFFLKHSFIGAVNFNVMNGMNFYDDNIANQSYNILDDSNQMNSYYDNISGAQNQINIDNNNNIIINQNYNIIGDPNQINNYNMFYDKLEDVLCSLCRVYTSYNSKENDIEYNKKNSNIIDNNIIPKDNDSEKNDNEYSFYHYFVNEDFNEHYYNNSDENSSKKNYFTFSNEKNEKNEKIKKKSNNFNNNFIKKFNIRNLLKTSIHDLGIIFYSDDDKLNNQLQEENIKLNKEIHNYLYNGIEIENKKFLKENKSPGYIFYQLIKHGKKNKNKKYSKENNSHGNISYKLIKHGKKNKNKKQIGLFINFIESLNELQRLNKIGEYLKLLKLNYCLDGSDKKDFLRSITLNDVINSAYTKYTNTQKEIENSIKKSFINNAEDFIKYIPTNYLDIEEVLPNIKKTYFYFNCKAFEPLIKDVYKNCIKDLYNLNHITSKYEDVPFSDKQINLLKNLYYYDFYNFINDTLTSENYYESFKEKILDIFEDFPNAKITNYIKNFIEKEYNDDFVNTLKYKKVSFNEFCSIYESISNKYEPVVTPRNFIEVTFDKNFIKEEYKRLYLNA